MLDEIHNLLVEQSPSFIYPAEDLLAHLLDRVEEMGGIEPGSFLFSMDVISLFSSVPPEEGIDVFIRYLRSQNYFELSRINVDKFSIALYKCFSVQELATLGLEKHKAAITLFPRGNMHSNPQQGR